MAYNKETGLYDGYIYLISNDINDKVYVGQTTITVRHRFNQHKLESKKENRHLPLYNAMHLYGIEHFYIDTLKVYCCESKDELLNLLNDSEIFYIEKYNSLSPNGYNMTKGGNNIAESEKVSVDRYDREGNFIKNYDSIVDTYYDFGDINFSHISECCNGKVKSAYDSVWRFKGEHFDKYNSQYHTKVDQYTIDGEFINTFESFTQASFYVGKGYNGVSAIIGCCHGKSLTAHGYVWRINGDSFDKYRTTHKSTNTMSKPVNQYDLDGNLIRTFDSITDAASFFGSPKSKSNIAEVCRGERKTAFKSKWSYV